MAYELLTSGRTQFAIDWDVVARIVRSYQTSVLQLEYGREVTMSQSYWYNPLSWSLPDISHVEVDWARVQRRADGDAAAVVADMRTEAKYHAPRVARRLEDMVDLTGRNKETFVDWIGTVQTQNMRAVRQAVDDYQASIEISTFVRDMSADGLMVGASAMSGGAAIAALGGASVFKGTCRFQDDGRVGAAVMEGAGSFAFCYFKLGNPSFKQEMALAFVQAPYAAGTELVAGASISEAVVSGALKLTGPSAEALFKLPPAKTLFDKVAVPLVVTYGGENVTSKLLTKFAGDTVQNRVIEPRGKDALLKPAGDAAKDTESATAGRRPGRVIGQSTLSNRLLLYLAFVNMEKGIGRGW
jgi:hypothetical protein